jgi:isopentenyl-diphosphate delta-isomerase
MQSARQVNYVELVNERGETTGQAEKLQAHREGLLHRAFSVFILNASGQILLQQRAWEKYHFAGLWSNACCSHPAPDENVLLAGERRLQEELGFTTGLTGLYSFVYRAQDPLSKLIEHEWDNVLLGRYAGPICPNPEEVAAYRWVEPDQLDQELAQRPEQFTPWLKLILPQLRLQQVFLG